MPKKPVKPRSLTARDVAVKGKVCVVDVPERAWPKGYVEFLARFGSGILEDLIVFTPPHVVKRTKDWKKLAPHAAKLFPNLREHFPNEDEASLIVVAASQNGDVIGFPDKRPGELFLFPRGSNLVIPFGATFNEALGAWCYGESICPRRVEKGRARFTAL